MTEWFVEITGNQRDINFLMQYLIFSEIFVLKDGDSVFIKSSRFLTLENPIEVHETALELLEIINGVAKILLPSFEGVLFESVGYKNKKGEWQKSHFLTAPATNYLVHADGSNEITILDIIQLASLDLAVARAVTLYGSLTHNWKNLYMVLEVIEEDLGGELALIKTYPKLTDQIKLFKRTTNSFEALGRDARHANMKYDAPQKAINLKEAKDLIREILDCWIRSKRSIGNQ